MEEPHKLHPRSGDEVLQLWDMATGQDGTDQIGVTPLVCQRC